MELIGLERPLSRHSYTYRPARLSREIDERLRIRLSFEKMSLPLFNQYLVMEGPGNEALWNTLKDLQ